MIPFLLILAATILVSIAGDQVSARHPLFAWWWYGSWTAAFTVTSAASAAGGSWGWAAWLAVCAVVSGFDWFRHGKRRKAGR